MAALEDLLKEERNTVPRQIGYDVDKAPSYYPYQISPVLDFYPSDVIEKNGVVLRKVNWYVMGSGDILGMVSTYSRRGMILEGLTGEMREDTVDHEVFHANQRPNDEATTRRYTCTEEPRLNPYLCALRT